MSDSELALDGVDFAELSPGGAGYSDPLEPAAYALVPAAAKDYTWARYSFGGVNLDKPISASVDLAIALDAPGGSPLPVQCWIGVANFTQAGWEWHGPYTAAAGVDLTLNAAAAGELPARTDRYLSAGGTLHLAVVSGGAQLSAVRIRALSVSTSASYLTNRPHYAAFTSASIGQAAADEGGRDASALTPEQFVHLGWEHVAALSPADLANTALNYLVYRQGPLDTEPLLVGHTGGTQFTEPLNLSPGSAEAVGGCTYHYFLQAENGAGRCPRDISPALTIPIFPPAAVNATLNQPDGTLSVVWSAVAGAEDYEIWRGDTPDGSSSAFLAMVGGEQLAYPDASAEPAREYWYFLRAAGLGDGNAANGYEPGSRSGLSLGARGVKALQLSLFCTTAGVAGNGTSGDPYLLEAGGSYQFTAQDQLGRDLTAEVSWAAIPPAAGSFSATTAGLLEDLTAGSGSFSVTAELGVLEYSWLGSAYCQTD